MLDFMDYIQLAFAEATNWNRDNSYSSLTATSQSILDFLTPERLRVHLSSLSTPHFATSYTLGTVGVIDGSVSYLFSTVPFDNVASKSTLIPLRRLAPGYQQVQAPVSPDLLLLRDNITRKEDPWHHARHSGTTQHRDSDDNARDGQKPTLLHAALHLPPPTTLNALFLRRLSPTLQWSLAVCSTRGPPLSNSAPQASLLTQFSHDTGKYSSEYLFSTDNALFGWKGLWNFGPDPRYATKRKHLLSLLSAGAEAYYSPLSSLIGMSMGLRFSTLPAPAGDVGLSSSTSSSASSSSSSANINNSPISTFPYTLTLTLTPLTGSLSTTYSVCASRNLAFSSRFSFNVYSWESEMVAGCELWRQSRRKSTATLTGIDDDDDDGLEWARRKMGISRNSSSTATTPTTTGTNNNKNNTELPNPDPQTISFPNNNENHHHQQQQQQQEEPENESVVKIRLDQSWNIRILWEGRVKELLISAGVGLGPLSFSSGWGSSSASASSSSTVGAGAGAGAGDGTASSSVMMDSSQSVGGGGGCNSGLSGAGSYWRGVGVSVLYSS